MVASQPGGHTRRKTAMLSHSGGPGAIDTAAAALSPFANDSVTHIGVVDQPADRLKLRGRRRRGVIPAHAAGRAARARLFALRQAWAPCRSAPVARLVLGVLPRPEQAGRPQWNRAVHCSSAGWARCTSCAAVRRLLPGASAFTPWPHLMAWWRGRGLLAASCLVSAPLTAASSLPSSPIPEAGSYSRLSTGYTLR